MISAAFWEALAAVLCAAGLLALARGRGALRWAQWAAPSLKRDAKPPPPREREPGGKSPQWTAVAFEYPAVAPCRAALADVPPIPYRPFKWGEYFVTMGIRSMPWDEWIELDRDFAHYHRIREHRIQTRSDRLGPRPLSCAARADAVFSFDAAVELVHELAEYLSRRFPDVYRVTRCEGATDAGGWYGLPAIRDVTIAPLGKTYSLQDSNPMIVAALLVQEDLAIMIEGTDGQYYLQAGAVLIPGMWRLRDKIGMSLDDIHISGTVPQFERKLQPSMSRFFRRMPVDRPVVRTNYSFQVVAPPAAADPLDPDELAWCRTMKGDEDAAAGEPGFLRMEGAAASDLADVPPDVDPALVRLRVERQTLRRLPRTGAVVFTIRVYLTPLAQLVQEPGVPGRLASAIRSWPEDVARYKARPVFASVLGYLDEHHRRQLDWGVTTP
ncbi:hypothetical protein PHLGIDRAFT_115974 [Phlebiopsis gigantea 11061_1 CR5-6]|uniref:DUF3445 domain-containing protein n=1 Tax=Phlebiopsis gigantea (strain 11061_1 CR5-6) TaxID=745531 RepID=A0A0C3SB81_PHLG1|nr:hypothetical protein PHLGIDRAFT_115974 [Phlebiopsis gigantea 11061_1 CR5-6]